MDHLKEPVNLKSKKHLVSIFATVAILFVIPLTVFATLALRDLRGRAAELPNPFPQKETEFTSNELLVKFKKASLGKIKENPKDTGLDSLNKQVKRGNLDKFQKVAKAGKGSNTAAEAFSWYKITLKGKQSIVKGSFDKVNGLVIKGYKDNPRNAKDTTELEIEARDLPDLAQTLQRDPNVEAVQPNYVVETLAVPNDPFYSSANSWGQGYDDLWGLKKINAAAAWDQTTGSASIIVADIDTGVDYNHPDLAANMWVNSKEIPGNGVDDDGNGYIDDYHGCNFINMKISSSGLPICGDPMDDHGHGTHTSGTIGAVGNNGIGVVGVNWTTKIMALKFLSQTGSGGTDDGVKALVYAADNGAKLSSNSWGGPCDNQDCGDQLMVDALKYEHDKGMLTVAAAGNSSNDALDTSPADIDYALTVSASDRNDQITDFSSYGERIDVAAPGGESRTLAISGVTSPYYDILSTKTSKSPDICSNNGLVVGANYCRLAGTSMATPHVAGLAALIWAKNPSLSNEEVRQMIHLGADDVGDPGKDIKFGYGRINAANSLTLAANHVLAPVITSPASGTKASGNLQILGSVPGPNFASYKIEASKYTLVGNIRTPGPWTTVATSNTQVTTDGVLATVNTTTLADGSYFFKLTATDAAGKNYQYELYRINIKNFDLAFTAPVSSVRLGQVDITGTVGILGGLTLASYKLEWSLGGSPLFAPSTTGITLVNGGTQPVANGKLAIWDTSTLTNGNQYSLRLTVTSTSGLTSTLDTTFIADQYLVAGWPKTVSDNGYWVSEPPVFADLDGDGQDEVISNHPVDQIDGSPSRAKISVWRKDGSNFPGFPAIITGPPNIFGGSTDYADRINVADLDGDGKKEIVLFVNAGYGYIVKSDGTLYPSSNTPTRFSYTSSSWDINPAIADIDGDGKKEIVFATARYNYDTGGAYQVKLYALHLDGTQVAGFPTTPFDTSANAAIPRVSIADLDGDGKAEIALSEGNNMYLFDSSGTLLPGWPYTAPNYNGNVMYFLTPPASGDIDGDGKKELVDSSVVPCAFGCDAQLYIWRKDGTTVSGWPKLAGKICDEDLPIARAAYHLNSTTPSLADIDNNGKDEIIVAACGLRIFDINGERTVTNGQLILSQPALADVDGDGSPDVVSGSRYYLIVSRKDGSIIFKRSFLRSGPNSEMLQTPEIATDMDHNGKEEIVAITNHSGSFSSSTNTISWNAQIYLWEIPPCGANSAHYSWPMIGGNPEKSSFLPLNGATGTSCGGVTPPPPPTGGDGTAPTVSLTQPANGATVPLGKTVSIQANASDNVKVSKVEFYVNSARKCSDTAAPFTCNWKVGTTAGTSYTLLAKAYDSSNNTANSTVTVTGGIDTTKPVVAFTSPTNASKVTVSTTVTLTATATDEVGVTKVEFYVNGSRKCSDTTSPYSCSWTVPTGTGITYTLLAKAYDAAGNITSSTITVTSQ